MRQNAETAPKRQKKSAPTPPSPPSLQPKPRVVLHLDLNGSLFDGEAIKQQKSEVDALLKLLRTKKKVVVVAGAGISVGAGIPDFRSADGLFSTLRTTGTTSGKDLFDASVYKDDHLTDAFHAMVRKLHEKSREAQPTEFHHLVASLAKEGRLLRLYSQNVDCLENRLEPLETVVPLPNKGPWPRTIQLHGGLEKMVCTKCHKITPFEPERFEGSQTPECPECAEMESVRAVAGRRSLGIGRLRPRIVLYNEFNPDCDAIGVVTQADLKARPDALIVVGTSMKIPGVKRIVREMCGVVQDYRGGMTVWINGKDEPPSGREFEGAFDLIVKGDCEKVAQLARMPRCDGSESPMASILELDPNELPRRKTLVEVQVPAHPVIQQCPTPSMSPRPHSSTKANPKKRQSTTPQEEIPTKRVKKLTAKAAAASKAAAKPKAIAAKQKGKQEVKPPLKATVKNVFRSTKSAVTSTTTKKTTAAPKPRSVPRQSIDTKISPTIQVKIPPLITNPMAPYFPSSPVSSVPSSPLSDPPQSAQSSPRITVQSLLCEPV